MSVRRAVDIRNENPIIEQDDEITQDDGVHHLNQTHWRLGGVLDSEWGVRLWANTMGIRECLHASESSAIRLSLNFGLGSALILMNAISVSDTQRRQQAIDHCHQNTHCPQTNHSNVMRTVLDSGVAPQETTAEIMGITTGVAMIGYSIARCGAILVNKYRNA